MSLRGLPFLLLAAAVLLLTAAPAFANGYGEYPPKLVWSPDGFHLAAVVGTELWIVDAYGSAYGIAYESPSSPSWSPDGSQLAYVQNGKLFIYGYSSDLSQQVRMLSGVLDCAFLPDADNPRVLVSYGERFYGCDIGLYEVRTGRFEPLVESRDQSECSPVPNPDGSGFAYLVQGDGMPGGYEQIFYKPFGRKPGRALTGIADFGEWGYHESNPRWTGEGLLLFERGGWGDWHLYQFDVESGTEELFLADAEQPALSKYMGMIAFVRRDPELKAEYEYDWEIAPSVWLRHQESGDEFQISPPGTWAEYPAISPDGTHVAWIEIHAEMPQVVIRTVVNALG
ncbi:MAG: PD40 domain-containing protein [bacterium]|jgi:hypothetical protein